MEKHSPLLVEAVKVNDLHLLDTLLVSGVSADVRDNDEFTALYWACCRGHVQACHRLLRRRCDVNAKGKSGATPLMACADNGHVTCVRLLLQDRNIRVNDCNSRGDTALHLAAYRGFCDVIVLLCKGGADVRLKNTNDQTPLGEAFIGGHVDCVRFLNKEVQEKEKSTNNNGQSLSNGRVHNKDLHSFPPTMTTGQPYRSHARSDMCGVSFGNIVVISDVGMPTTRSRDPECVDERLPSVLTADNSRNHTPSISSPISVSPATCPDLLSISYSCSSDIDNRRLLERRDSGNHSLDPKTTTASTSAGTFPGTSDTSLGHLASKSIQQTFYSQNPSSIDSQYQSISETSIEDLPRASGISHCSRPPNHSHATVNPSCTHSLPLNIPIMDSNHTSEIDNLSGHFGNAENTLSDMSSLNTRPASTYSTHTKATDFASSSMTYPKVHGVGQSKHGTAYVSPTTVSEDRVSTSTSDKRDQLYNDRKISSFVENLQMQILKLQESLEQERNAKSAMRQEMNSLAKENAGLRFTVKTLSAKCSELKSQLSEK